MKIKIRVNPKSKKSEVIKKGEQYIVNVKSPAENNKANIELLKVLKKYFGKDVEIKSGKTSRRKIVEMK